MERKRKEQMIAVKTGKVKCSRGREHDPAHTAKGNGNIIRSPSLSHHRKPAATGGIQKGTSPSGQQDRPHCWNFKMEKHDKDTFRDYWHPSECIYHERGQCSTGTHMLSFARKNTRKSTTNGRNLEHDPYRLRKM